MKLKPAKKGEDILHNLGDLIEEHFKKGVKKVEKILKEPLIKAEEDGDDKPFSYIRAFLDDKGVASVAPSSRYLVDRVIKTMELRKAEVVVEYGAAEGVMTRRILDKLPAKSKLIAVELNDKLFQSLKLIDDPRLRVVQGDVRQIDRIMAEHGNGSVDVIVSGIPFAFLRGRERHELLTKTSDFLRPGGRFVAYQVTTHLIPLLTDYFSKVKTQFEIRNLPPHFVFTAFK